VRRLVKGVLVVAAVAVVAAAGVLAYAMSQIDRVPVAGLDPGTDGQLNVLVVGSDSREGLSEQQLQELGTTRVEGRRTDTILVLSVRNGRAALLAFPRDLYVTGCDGDGGRINTTYATGGPSCLAQTVSRVSGLDLDHYMEVDFSGFLEMVNAVGGVRMRLDEPLRDRAAGVDLPAGPASLNGEQALGVVRARQQSSDLVRITRQQRFIAALADEIAGLDTLANPVRAVNVVEAATGALTADSGLGVVEAGRLGLALRGIAGGQLSAFTVPTRPTRVGGAAVLEPTAAADELYTRFRRGSVLTSPTPSPAPGGVSGAGGVSG
jgi:LCP family protein required for cell wall assembly